MDEVNTYPLPAPHCSGMNIVLVLALAHLDGQRRLRLALHTSTLQHANQGPTMASGHPIAMVSPFLRQ